VTVEKLLDDHMFPVCSPSVLANHGPFDSPAALLSHTLLIDDTREIDGFEPTWQSWFELAGEVFAPSGDFKKFGQSNMVVQAALAGRGIALGRSALVVDALRTGQLVVPVKQAFPSGFSHYLITAKGATNTPGVAAFRDWIKRQADVSNATIADLLDSH
ncbi:MAG: LysR substrate-binding domain-containing protein, partial [Woeseiales bacterium]